MKNFWTALSAITFAALLPLTSHAAPTSTLFDASDAIVGDEDSVLDDVFGTADENKESTVAEEAEAFDETAEREARGTKEVEIPPAKRKVIKTLQRKTFLKLGRFEATPFVGSVLNDAFLNRYPIGIGLSYHPTEILGIEIVGAYAHAFGDGDLKPITKQLIEKNQVSPDISRMLGYFTGSVQFSPIYGKVAVFGRNIINFDIFTTFGTGVVITRDDLEILQATTDVLAIASENEVHPTITFGGGLRVVLNPNFALRFEGRSMSYIEVLRSQTLEVKNQALLNVGASFFFPAVK